MATDTEVRRTGLGGTDVSAILQLNPFRSPFDVFLEKRGEVQPHPEDNRKRWGKRLQRVIADAYAEETGREIEWADNIRSHPTRPWMLWTPDALCKHEPRGVDAKTAGLDQAPKWGESGTANVPDYVALQCVWYMAASERLFWDVALLIAGSDFRIYTIERDLELEGIVLEAAEKFWRDHVLTGKPPEITATDTTNEWIKRRFATSNGRLRSATVEELGLMLEYRDAQKAFEIHEKRRDDLEARVKVAIGESDGITWRGGYVTYKLTKGFERPASTVAPHRRIYKHFDERK